jgi:hypothetical protein
MRTSGRSFGAPSHECVRCPAFNAGNCGNYRVKII